MADTGNLQSGNSGEDWRSEDWRAAFFSFPDMAPGAPGNAFMGSDWGSRQFAQSALMSLELFEAWLAGSRKLIDGWRDSMREQQDEMIANARKQLTAAEHKASK